MQRSDRSGYQHKSNRACSKLEESYRQKKGATNAYRIVRKEKNTLIDLFVEEKN